MLSFAGKNILVVGATGAFGGEFCAQLNVAGATVIGTASSNASSVRLPTSLSQRLLLNLEDAQSIQALTAYLNSLPGAIDGIVLAAGLVAFGSVAETPIAVTERLMKVNVLGQISLVQQLLPKLQESAAAGREPFVLSISGVISESPMQGLASYSASKTALHGFATAAAKEFRKLGIAWVDARPGHTESGLAGRAIFGTAPNFGDGKNVPDVIARMLYGLTVGEKDLPSTVF